MSAYLFTVPLAAGKTDTWKKYMKEITESRHDDYMNSRKRLGINVEQVFLQQTPKGDMCVVRWDTENFPRAFENMVKSQDPFDKWFRDKILIECHDMDLSKPIPTNKQVLDHHGTPSHAVAGS